MLLLALVISGLSAPETRPASAAQDRDRSVFAGEIYAPPAVRPYEPPSSFGRQTAEGDADAMVRARPIPAPVAVEVYADSYEPRRSPRELSYEQGVDTARVAQNARMGSLDGVWRVIDAEGRPILDLVLSDRGAGRPVEGALRFAREDNTAVVEVTTTGSGGRIVSADVSGRAVSLHLTPSSAGWSGELTGVGRDQTVSLARPAGWAP